MADEHDICDECGVQNESVWFTTDPFADEIHNKQVWMFLCDNCWQEMALDI